MNPVINPVEALYIQVQFVATIIRIFIVILQYWKIREIKKFLEKSKKIVKSYKMIIDFFIIGLGVFFHQKIKKIMGFFKSDITLDCTDNAKKFSISDIQHIFSTLESLILLTQYIPIDMLVRSILRNIL